MKKMQVITTQVNIFIRVLFFQNFMLMLGINDVQQLFNFMLYVLKCPILNHLKLQFRIQFNQQSSSLKQFYSTHYFNLNQDTQQIYFMKPIFKVLTSPFRSSKRKTTKKQENEQESPENGTIALQNNIDAQQGVSKDSAKFKFVYSQVERIVDQLGGMLSSKQKMTDAQKRQLIYELSSMALNDKKMKSQLFDQDVLESDDDDSCQHQVAKQTKNTQQPIKQTISDALIRQNSDDKPEGSPKNQQDPEKQLKQLFQTFEKEQQGKEGQKDKQSGTEIKDKTKDDSASSYFEIKSRMSKFWSKNSSKVLKLMKSKKEQTSSNSKKKSYQSIKSLPKDKKLSQIQQQTPQMIDRISHKKKKKSIFESILGSWNGKKQQKTLDSTAPFQFNEKNCMNVDVNGQQNPQGDTDVGMEQTKMQFSIKNQR